METVFNIPHGEGNPRNSEGSFVKLKDGSILYIYTRYHGNSWDDAATADLVAIKSQDGGKTWSDYTIVRPNKAQNVMSVSLQRLQDGRIMFMFLEKSRFTCAGANGCASGYLGDIDCRPWCCFSSDEGATWSEEQDIARYLQTYIVVNNDRIVQLKSGRIIVPGAIPHIVPSPKGSEYRFGYCPRAEGFFFLSDDGGKTWRESKECCYPPSGEAIGFQEPGVIELADGRIMAWFRTSGGHQYKAFSYDGAESWSAPEIAYEFPSPAAPLSMKRNPKTGELVAVWDDIDPRWNIDAKPKSWMRTPLVIAFSSDEGRTWHGHRKLEEQPDHGYCYTAMLFDGDDLLLAYCCGGGDSGVLQDLRIRRIELK